ncbi:MAG: Rpn family recombination-promoting nuclease/putative transposase [Tolypothrix carrinoi HA7290-LM1]|jgi:predicted transposase YdaD|nr:Rpn family recombination-promoting nuclease/putative transposase [Tolypothrix carrinoi HA7290-LM1]
MAKVADIGGKRLISLAPDAWVKWVTQSPDVLAREILASEFQWISRESDVVVKAYHPQIGDFLVLNELQLRYNTRLPRRMRAYAALAEERYNLPVYPVLINILPPPETMEIVSNYESQVLGLQARQDYRVINLWEVDAQIVFQQPLPSLLPFVPVLKGGDEIAVVQLAVQALRADEQLNELEPLLAFFASFVLSSRLVQQIMRWDMAVLQESPWYQEILQQGETRGLLSGIELGLELKFGAEGLQLMPEISQITDLDVLKTIREGLRTMNSLEEIRQIYTINET